MLAKKHQITIGLFILIQCLFVFNAKAQKSFVYYGLCNGDGYGLKQNNKQNYSDTICITPPIYHSIGNFNKFGLATITRSAPFFSLINPTTPNYYHPSDDSVIINYWYLFYPDSSFNNYKVVGSVLDKQRYYFDFWVSDSKNNVLHYHNFYNLTMEDLLGSIRHKNYVDQWGNFYPNVFNLSTEQVMNGSELIFFHDQKGLINENGKVVLPLIYDYVGLKADEVLYKNQNPIYPIVYRNKLGFIDSTGKVIIEPKFENNIHSEGVKDMTEGERFEVNRFFDGICKIEENDKFGIIDKTGKVIIPIIYEHIYFEFTNDHDIPYEHILYITAQDNLGNSFKYDLKGNLIENK
ncbi:MAG: WG repeat-containing protein [Bacteroidia bacterium]